MKIKTVERMKHLSSIGLNPDDVQRWMGKWLNLKGDAKGNGREFTLTFEQYTQLAVDAGIKAPSEIGQTLDSYCMGRVGDSGGYTLGNCRFITQRQNQTERRLNGGAKLGGEKCSKTKGKDFMITSPDGQTYTGKNVSNFCRDFGLNACNMNQVCAGKEKHHKGWTGRYV